MAKKTSIDHYKEAVQNLRDPGSRKPVYYLYGDESFFLDLLQEEVIKLVAPEQRDFNLDLLYGNDTSPEQALGIARSYPMMSEIRVVIIRDFSKMKKPQEGDSHINDFIPYLEQPNPNTVLCLIDDKSPDKRTKLGKALTGSKTVYSREFEQLPDYKLPDWTADWIKFQHDKQIDPQAAQIMIQLVGNDLQLLSTELDKVCTFVDTEKTVHVDHVKKIIGSYREYSVIELKDAVIERDLERSIRIAEQMLLHSNTDTGEIIRTVGFFYSVFANIWNICRYVDKGISKSRVQQEMGIRNDWYFNQLWNDASHFKLAEIPQIYEALLDADRAAKGFSTLHNSSILLLMVRRIVG